MKERQICKDKCDRIKTNIRSNRLKFQKNVEEFGEDNELNEECGEIDVDEELNKGISSKQSRHSAAPSQVNAIQAEDPSSRQSALSTIQLQQMSAQAVVCQGYEYHIANTRIDYTFKDEEIAFLVN